MEVRNVTLDDVRDAIARANVRGGYAGNIVLQDATQIRKDGTSWRVKLTVESSRGKGARVSADPLGEGRRRRVAALCWHGFRDVFRELFDARPEAVVVTAVARYNGRDGFEEAYPATYYRNAGSMFNPQNYGELCGCDDDDETLGFLETRGGGRPMRAYSADYS